MIKNLLKLNSAGDTIVEVLIVLSIIGFSIAISSASANGSLTKSRNSEEHSEALGLLSSQVELLRSASSQQVNTQLGTAFCMSGNSTVAFSSSAVLTTLASPSPYPGSCVYPSGCNNSQACYYLSIVYTPTTSTSPPSQDNYDFKVLWYGPNSAGLQKEEITYRIHQLTANATSGIPLTSSPSGINVFVRKVPAGPGNTTPSCSIGTTDYSGASVTLNGTDVSYSNTQITNNATPGAYFADLTDSAHYYATLNSLPNATSNQNPSYANGGFQLCGSNVSPPPPAGQTPGPTSPSVQLTPGTTPSITYSFIPVCWVSSYTPPPTTVNGAPIYSYWWWHTSDQVNNGYLYLRDWGPNGFNKSGTTYIKNSPSWESALGISPVYDRPAASLAGVVPVGGTGGGQVIWEGPGWGDFFNPSLYGFPNSSADGFAYFQNYNYGTLSSSDWYNFFEEVQTLTGYKQVPYQPPTVYTNVCPS